MYRTALCTFTLLACAACRPRADACERPDDAPVSLQVLAAPQAALNLDDRGASWPTNLRVYELRSGADLDRLEFAAVFEGGEKAFGDAFVKAHEFTAYPDRRARWTIELGEDTTHVVTVGLFRRPLGDAWYQVYAVPTDHRQRRCEAEARGLELPEPCLYLALEHSELSGGRFPPAGFDIAAFATKCAPLADPPAKKKKPKKKKRERRRPTLPTLPTLPSVPSAPTAPSVPSVPSAPTAPTAPTAPQAPKLPGGMS